MDPYFMGLIAFKLTPVSFTAAVLLSLVNVCYLLLMCVISYFTRRLLLIKHLANHIYLVPFYGTYSIIMVPFYGTYSFIKQREPIFWKHLRSNLLDPFRVIRDISHDIYLTSYISRYLTISHDKYLWSRDIYLTAYTCKLYVASCSRAYICCYNL